MNPEPPPIADPHSTAPASRRNWRRTIAELFLATSSIVLFLLGALFIPLGLGYLPAPLDIHLPTPFIFISVGMLWLLAVSAFAFWQESVKRHKKGIS